MKVSPFAVVSALLQSKEAAVRIANRFDQAYCDSVRPPVAHVPFGADEPERISMNLAGLYAADAAANAIAALHLASLSQGVPAAAYLAAVMRIACADLNEHEWYIARNFANATWRAGQPFRDIATKTLGRLKRSVNTQFNLLPPEEVMKDGPQLVLGAKIILEEIDRANREATAA